MFKTDLKTKLEAAECRLAEAEGRLEAIEKIKGFHDNSSVIIDEFIDLMGEVALEKMRIKQLKEKLNG